ncbi:CotY/CotZ family spore coat protein [Robertmurraya sp. DFI.2.37]|jgi:spore coat protein Z|uniref:CotY/CotZ family spore coat protein n=1 Tax=Robertmurraya sp. DFI.2.37 TaxID=3031819 RepID=UPI0012485D81|nr:CotY/CotZ family spore coat protein [Robertmurraya sp. DFI.2.37]MDF1507470.1 CotY/CotZ family spore coat protein [Robertmurraya sp. DFI.2.37]
MGCGKKDDVQGVSRGNCVCEVVRAIKDIQDAAEDVCECPSNCFQEPLGSLIKPGKRQRVDTRVFVLKTADGSPFHAFFRHDECACVSIFFRVEEIFDNCCATLRVIKPVQNGEAVDLTHGSCIDLSKICQVEGFRSTNDCITVDLSCFCAIQCVADVDLNICED